MRNSHLWQAIEPHIVVGRRVTILRALEEADRTTRVRAEETSLDGAFVWAESPQGHNFWSEVALDIRQRQRVAAARVQVQVDPPIQAQPRARARAQVSKPEAKKSNVVRIPAD